MSLAVVFPIASYSCSSSVYGLVMLLRRHLAEKFCVASNISVRVCVST